VLGQRDTGVSFRFPAARANEARASLRPDRIAGSSCVGAGQSALAARELLRHGRIEIRCRGRGYGAMVRRSPERCPMCGGSVWETVTREGATSPPTRAPREAHRGARKAPE